MEGDRVERVLYVGNLIEGLFTWALYMNSEHGKKAKISINSVNFNARYNDSGCPQFGSPVYKYPDTPRGLLWPCVVFLIKKTNPE